MNILAIIIAACIILLPILMVWGGIFGRMGGGGLWAQRWRANVEAKYGKGWQGSLVGRFPEMMLTLPLGLISAAGGYIALRLGFDIVLAWYWVALWAFVAWNVSYWTYEMGHGTTQNMGGYEIINGDATRVDSNEQLVRRLFPKVKRDTPLYSWLCMGYKGLLVTSPTGPLAILGAIAYPTAYWMGRRVEPSTPGMKESGNHGVAEVFAGMAVMLPASLALAILIVVCL